MQKPLQIGWIDFGTRDRNKILSVLSLLSAPEAVDELGIGVLRDGFADLLFPGTSTIQTRAKYFLIIPYILREIEQEKNLTPKSLLERLARDEIALIDTLKKDNAEGVIGGRAGEKLQRRPSSIYWNGLNTYGIFNYASRMSLESYAQAVCKVKAQNNSLLSSGHSDKGEGSDDSGIQSSEIGFWRAPWPTADWRESVTMALTYDEAYFLRERIIKSEQSKNSLLAFILKNNLAELADYDDPFFIGKSISLPEDIRNDYEMAMRFSDFIYGANIRYNVILSNGENEDANEKWQSWYEEVSSGLIQNYDVYEAFNRLSIGGHNLSRLRPFMSKWKQAVISGDAATIDNVIVEREMQLKGRERAKLRNSSVYLWKDSVWLGGGKLQYRFRTVKNLIRDIFNGLDGGKNV